MTKEDFKRAASQNRHEYRLFEERLREQRIIDAIEEKFKCLQKECIDPLKTDVTVLKTSYGFIYGGLALIGSGIAYIFYWMFGHVQEAHIVAKQMSAIFKSIRVC